MRNVTPIGKRSPKWRFVVLGIIMFICLGTVYSWSVFKTPFEQLHGINAVQSGMPYLVFLTFYTIFMIVSGRFVDRYNPKAIIALGGILVGIGWMASGLTHNFYAVIFFYGVVSGSGVGIAYGVPIKVVSNWFEGKKGLALGLLLSGFGLSPFVTAPIIKLLLKNYGVNQTFIYVGIAFGIIIPLAGLFFRHPEDNSDTCASNYNEEKILALFKKREFIGLWACFASGATIGLMVIGVTSQIGTELFGISSHNAALLISLFAVFNALGRPLFGYLTDKIGVRRAALLSFFLIIAASSLMFFTKLYSTAVFVISLSILWMNLGAWLSIAPTATGMLFNPKNYARNYGVLFSAYGVGAMLGTPIAGFIRTNLGSYVYVFLPVVALALTGIIVSFILLKPKRTQ